MDASGHELAGIGFDRQDIAVASVFIANKSGAFEIPLSHNN